MSKYIIRLDDASEKRDIEKWNHMELILDKYEVKPLVGVIPCCHDTMMDKYPIDNEFWNTVLLWKNKKWCIAMHGYEHVYITDNGGINPVNNRSEFAGVPIEFQKEKIKKGVDILRAHGINPQVFFAPSHTFDQNTIIALQEESDITIISDTVADRPYSRYGMTFVPQQSGHVRKLPFKLLTFCYHPNMMIDHDFDLLERFIKKNRKDFIEFPVQSGHRNRSLYDIFMQGLYWKLH